MCAGVRTSICRQSTSHGEFSCVAEARDSESGILVSLGGLRLRLAAEVQRSQNSGSNEIKLKSELKKEKKKKWAKYTVCCEIWTQSKGKNKIKQAARRMSIERDEIVKRRVIPEDIDGWKYSTWLNFTVCPLGWIREINEVMDGQRHFVK